MSRYLFLNTICIFAYCVKLHAGNNTQCVKIFSSYTEQLKKFAAGYQSFSDFSQKLKDRYGTDIFSRDRSDGFFELEDDILELIKTAPEYRDFNHISTKYGISNQDAEDILLIYVLLVFYGDARLAGDPHNAIKRLSEMRREFVLTDVAIEMVTRRMFYLVHVTLHAVPEMSKILGLSEGAVRRELSLLDISIVEEFSRPISKFHRKHILASIRESAYSDLEITISTLSNPSLIEIIELLLRCKVPLQEIARLTKTGEQAIAFILHHVRKESREVHWARFATFEGRVYDEVQLLVLLRERGYTYAQIGKKLNDVYGTESPSDPSFRTEASVGAKLAELGLTESTLRSEFVYDERYGYLKQDGKLIAPAAILFIFEHAELSQEQLAASLEVSIAGLQSFMNRHFLTLGPRRNVATLKSQRHQDLPEVEDLLGSYEVQRNPIARINRIVEATNQPPKYGVEVREYNKWIKLRQQEPEKWPEELSEKAKALLIRDKTRRQERPNSIALVNEIVEKTNKPPKKNRATNSKESVEYNAWRRLLRQDPLNWPENLSEKAHLILTEIRKSQQEAIGRIERINEIVETTGERPKSRGEGSDPSCYVKWVMLRQQNANEWPDNLSEKARTLLIQDKNALLAKFENRPFNRDPITRINQIVEDTNEAVKANGDDSGAYAKWLLLRKENPQDWPENLSEKAHKFLSEEKKRLEEVVHVIVRINQTVDQYGEPPKSAGERADKGAVSKWSDLLQQDPTEWPKDLSTTARALLLSEKKRLDENGDPIVRINTIVELTGKVRIRSGADPGAYAKWVRLREQDASKWPDNLSQKARTLLVQEQTTPTVDPITRINQIIEKTNQPPKNHGEDRDPGACVKWYKLRKQCPNDWPSTLSAAAREMLLLSKQSYDEGSQ